MTDDKKTPNLGVQIAAQIDDLSGNAEKVRDKLLDQAVATQVMSGAEATKQRANSVLAQSFEDGFRSLDPRSAEFRKEVGGLFGRVYGKFFGLKLPAAINQALGVLVTDFDELMMIQGVLAEIEGMGNAHEDVSEARKRREEIEAVQADLDKKVAGYSEETDESMQLRFLETFYDLQALRVAAFKGDVRGEVKVDGVAVDAPKHLEDLNRRFIDVFASNDSSNDADVQKAFENLGKDLEALLKAKRSLRLSSKARSLVNSINEDWGELGKAGYHKYGGDNKLARVVKAKAGVRQILNHPDMMKKSFNFASNIGEVVNEEDIVEYTRKAAIIMDLAEFYQEDELKELCDAFLEVTAVSQSDDVSNFPIKEMFAAIESHPTTALVENKFVRLKGIIDNDNLGTIEKVDMMMVGGQDNVVEGGEEVQRSRILALNACRELRKRLTENDNHIFTRNDRKRQEILSLSDTELIEQSRALLSASNLPQNDGEAGKRYVVLADTITNYAINAEAFLDTMVRKASQLKPIQYEGGGPALQSFASNAESNRVRYFVRDHSADFLSSAGEFIEFNDDKLRIAGNIVETGKKDGSEVTWKEYREALNTIKQAVGEKATEAHIEELKESPIIAGLDGTTNGVSGNLGEEAEKRLVKLLAAAELPVSMVDGEVKIFGKPVSAFSSEAGFAAVKKDFTELREQIAGLKRQDIIGQANAIRDNVVAELNRIDDSLIDLKADRREEAIPVEPADATTTSADQAEEKEISPREERQILDALRSANDVKFQRKDQRLLGQMPNSPGDVTFSVQDKALNNFLNPSVSDSDTVQETNLNSDGEDQGVIDLVESQPISRQVHFNVDQDTQIDSVIARFREMSSDPLPTKRDYPEMEKDDFDKMIAELKAEKGKAGAKRQLAEKQLKAARDLFANLSPIVQVLRDRQALNMTVDVNNLEDHLVKFDKINSYNDSYTFRDLTTMKAMVADFSESILKDDSFFHEAQDKIKFYSDDLAMLRGKGAAMHRDIRKAMAKLANPGLTEDEALKEAESLVAFDRRVAAADSDERLAEVLEFRPRALDVVNHEEFKVWFSTAKYGEGKLMDKIGNIAVFRNEKRLKNLVKSPRLPYPAWANVVEAFRRAGTGRCAQTTWIKDALIDRAMSESVVKKANLSETAKHKKAEKFVSDLLESTEGDEATQLFFEKYQEVVSEKHGEREEYLKKKYETLRMKVAEGEMGKGEFAVERDALIDQGLDVKEGWWATLAAYNAAKARYLGKDVGKAWGATALRAGGNLAARWGLRSSLHVAGGLYNWAIGRRIGFKAPIGKLRALTKYSISEAHESSKNWAKRHSKLAAEKAAFEGRVEEIGEDILDDEKWADEIAVSVPADGGPSLNDYFDNAQAA